ncbi:hypothetical protein BKA81DRAFT_368854 [Phyllosticta paracitricarpa]
MAERFTLLFSAPAPLPVEQLDPKEERASASRGCHPPLPSPRPYGTYASIYLAYLTALLPYHHLTAY